jgi:AraC-like DNA-binding protein
MVKSVSYYFSPDHYLPGIFENIGFAANAFITPLLYLYLKAYLFRDAPFRRIDMIHLVPGILIILLSPFITSEFWLHRHGYEGLLYLMVAYLPVCIYLLYRHFGKLSAHERMWLVSLVAGITLVWAAYAANFLLGLVSYITAPVIFSFVMYVLSFIGLRQNNIFIRETKYKNSLLANEEASKYVSRLNQLMTDTKAYKEPDLTLPKVAKLMNVPPHQLSQVINEHMGQSFSDYINQQRIIDSKQMLSDPACINQKIAAIAYDNGFNTLSAFNAAFRKFTQMTPSEYRKKFTSQRLQA